jgi:hypothetical protein
MFVRDAPHPPSASRPEASEPSELPLDKLEAELTSACSRVYAGTCRWLELVAEFDRRDGWMQSVGVRSCAEWLAWRCALSSRAAREHLRVARALGGLPGIHAAFSTGALSFSKVRALTRIATPESEDDLLHLARHATAAQLERMIRAARRVSDAEALAAQETAYGLWFWDDDGSLIVRAKLPPEEGAALLKAIELARDDLRESRAPKTAFRGSAEPQSGEESPDIASDLAPDGAPDIPCWPTNAECLAYVADRALRPASGDSPDPNRYEVVVHVDADRLSGAADAEGRAHLEDGPAIAPGTAKRVACDAAVVALFEASDGSVLSVGRRTRAIPPAMRRALRVRDGGCRFPGCEQLRFTDGHHIRHWADGGETELDNLVLLCRRHHTLLHEGDYTLEGSASALTFRDKFGRGMPAAPPLPRAASPPSSGGSTILAGTGERIDLGLCVDAVLAAGH